MMRPGGQSSAHVSEPGPQPDHSLPVSLSEGSKSGSKSGSKPRPGSKSGSKSGSGSGWGQPHDSLALLRG
eukprot:1646705-Rhodomonas_salina.4